MNHPDSHPLSGQSRDIDLIKLLIDLWQGRITILICATLAVALSAGYLWFEKPRWTSSALITLPGDADMASYTSLTNILAPVIASKVMNLPGNDKSAVSNGDSKVMSFSRAQAMLNARVSHIPGLNVEPVNKTQPWPLKVSVSTNNAEAAMRELNTVLKDTDNELHQTVKDEMDYLIDTRIMQLNTFISAQEQVAQEKKADRLENLKQALIVAREANISQLSVQQVSTLNNDALFVLGSDALSAMIDNERSRPLQLSESYYQYRQELLELNTFRAQPFQYTAFSYIAKPQVPAQSDNGRGVLIMIVALLLGSFAGIALTLIRKTLRDTLSYRTQIA